MRKGANFRLPVTTLVGSNIRNLIEVCRGHTIEARYLLKFILTVIVAAIFEILNLYERILWSGRISKVRMTSPPIFIVGFWRSGTTFLHNILCQDPRAAYTTTFHAVFPNLVLTNGLFVKWIANFLMPSQRPFDRIRMNFEYPQEEEFGLANILPDSFYNIFLFPKDFNQIYERDLIGDKLESSRLEQWKVKYDLTIRKSILHTGGTRYIGKNPCNIPRIKILRQMYPGSKFVFIYRNPYTVVESLYRFILSINRGVQLQASSPEFTRESVARMYSDLMRRYFDTRSSLDKSELIEIRMEDFMQDPLKSIERIYGRFEMEGFSDALPHFSSYLQQGRGGEHEAYVIDPETYIQVNKYAMDIVTGLGYEVMQDKTKTREMASPVYDSQ